MKTTIISLVIVGLSAVAPAVAQRREVRDTKENVRLVRTKPSIYLEFVKAGICHPNETTTVESWSPCKSTTNVKTSTGYEAVWLRIRNNSRWAINFDALSLYVGNMSDAYKLSDGNWVTSIRDGVEIRARYRVDAEIAWEPTDTPNSREYKLVDIRAPIYNRVPDGTISRVWLPPGQSAVFVVRREHLAKYLMVYLPYKYQWDGDQNDLVSPEPTHRVYFDWYKLRKALGLE